jgi:hypothetical protein
MSVDEVAGCSDRQKSGECCERRRSCCSTHHDVLHLKAPAVSAVHQVIIDNIRRANRTVRWPVKRDLYGQTATIGRSVTTIGA